MVGCIGLFFLQRKFIYYPTPTVNNPNFEHFMLNNKTNSENIQLKIWKISPKNMEHRNTPALLYFGGNSESVEHNLASFQQQFPNRTIYFMNYRGFGGSQGSPNEAGIYSDALALFDKAHEQHQQIDVIGRSLGSGVASYLAIKRSVNKLILITAYDSIEAIASRKFVFFPVRFILKDRYRSLLRAPKLIMPTLLVTAENDKMIPREHTDNLWNALPKESGEQVILAGTNHNNIFSHPDFYSSINNFLTDDK